MTTNTLYTITAIQNKREKINPVHEKVLHRPAYIRDVIPGESAEILYLCCDDHRYHTLWTSSVLSVTPWENGEDTVIIETKNTIYTLEKAQC
jgi:hypothetical protein